MLAERRMGNDVRRSWPGLAFLAIAAVLVVTVWQSATHFAPAEAGLLYRAPLEHGDGVLGNWLFWDATAMRDIADGGYAQSDVETFDSGGPARVAYFPGYPIAARAASVVIGDLGMAMILVTFVSGLALAVVFHRWLEQQVGPAAARWAALALLLFPWAFFLVATGYGDALFVLFAVGAFALLEKDRPVAAGIAGAIASLTRPTGLAVIVGLAVRAAERRGALRLEGRRLRLDRALLRRRDYGVLVAAMGMGAYVAFCWIRYGDPVAFSTAQRGWNQANEPRTWFKLRLVELIVESSDTWFVLRLVLQGAVALVFCAAIPAVWRRLGAGYAIYTAVALVPGMISSVAFASHGRYVLASFPVFAVLGERLARWPRSRSASYLVASAGVLVLFTSFWARGYWMG